MAKSVSLLGVPVTLRPSALASGTLSALVAAVVARDNRALLSVGAGLLWYVADCTHVVGHIASSQAVDAPLDAIDFGLYPRNVYHNNDVTPQQHIGRSIGGLGGSLVAASVFTLLARSMNRGLGKQLLTIAAIQNTLLFVLSLLPIPIVDGGVIYANLRKLNE